MGLLSVLVDAGELFVKACYNLEGDGQIAPICYDILSSVKAAVQVKYWPNTRAVAWRLAEEFNTTPGLQQKLNDYATGCVQPGFDYFEDKFWTEFLPIVNAFKAARLFNPEKVTDLKTTASSMEGFFSFLEDLFQA